VRLPEFVETSGVDPGVKFATGAGTVPDVVPTIG
jgi:hypothetical protein